VKLSSEQAGALTITPVVSQEMSFRELLDQIVAATGKDLDRILRILRAGELTSGATRYRWAGWEAERGEIAAELAFFPEADPARAFEPQLAVKAVFQDPLGARVEFPQEAGLRKRLLGRRSFWDSLIEILAGEQALYVEYSYKEKADCYRVRLSQAAAAEIRNHAGKIAYKALAQKIKLSTFEAVDIYVPRPGVRS
jgi:hypothetical protein